MSVDAIKKFLEDTKNHPDTVMVTIGETQIPLGSLRQLNSSERTQLADRLKAVEATEADLKSRQTKIVDLATKAQAAYDAAETARAAAAAATPPAKPGDDPFADPWLAPVKAALDARDKKMSDLSDSLAKTVNTIVNAATIFSEDRWDRQYQSIDFGKREKKPTREEILKFASDNNIVDRHKLPSILLAWEKMNEADRLKEMTDKAREEGIEQGRQQALANRIPPPGVAGPGQAPVLTKTPGAGGDLGDLYAESLKDPELRALVEAAAAAGVM